MSIDINIDNKSPDQILALKGEQLTYPNNMSSGQIFLLDRNGDFSVVSYIGQTTDGGKKFAYMSGNKNGVNFDTITNVNGEPKKTMFGQTIYNKDLSVLLNPQGTFYKINGVTYGGKRRKTRKNKRKSRKSRKSRRRRNH